MNGFKLDEFLGKDAHLLLKNISNVINELTPPPVINHILSDILETEELYIIIADMPGCQKQDISAEIEDEYRLVIRASYIDYITGFTIISKERRTQPIKREYELPEYVDTKSIEAKYEHGILYIKFNKIVYTKNSKSVQIL